MPCLRKKDSIPSARASANTPPTPIGKYLVPVFILLGIVAAFTATYFFMSADKTSLPVKIVAPETMPPNSSPPPAQVIAATAPQAAQPARQTLNKMQIVETDCRRISQNPYLYAAR